MIRVVLRVEHLDETADLRALGAAVVVEGADVLEDVGHLVNGVVAALGRGTMAGDALDIDADFHAAPVPAIDAAVRRLGGDDELGLIAVLVIDVLPAHAVTVFFLDGANDHDAIALGNKVEVLHDLSPINCRGEAALLVRAAAAVDDVIGLIAGVGVISPVVTVADADSVNMAVNGDNLVATAHPADDITEAIHFHLVKVELFHLGLDAGDDLLLMAALARMGDHGTQEGSDVWLIGFRGFFDPVIVKFLHGSSLRPATHDCM